MKIKQILAVASISLVCLLNLAPGLSLAAVDCSQSNLTTQQAIQCGTDSAGGNQGSAENNVDSTITTLINVLSTVVGVVAVIMLIVGGLRYITSGGNTEKVTSAKNTILYAIIGLIIVALAQVIVQFVLDKSIHNCQPNGKTPSGQKCTP